jgi:hypothetical protein
LCFMLHIYVLTLIVYCVRCVDKRCRRYRCVILQNVAKQGSLSVKCIETT